MKFITVFSTTTSTIASSSNQLTFAQMEELINKYTLELEEQEKLFINQATQVNTWDNLLNSNSNKVSSNIHICCQNSLYFNIFYFIFRSDHRFK